MNKGHLQKGIVAQSVLNFIPPKIRTTLLKDSDFRKENGLSIDALLTFNTSDISFKRSELYDAIRETLNSLSPVAVLDKNGQVWELADKSDRNNVRLILKNKEHRLVLSDFYSFHPDSATRLRLFEKIGNDSNLPMDEIEKWKKTLSRRVLEDDEKELLDEELINTPVNFVKSLRKEIDRKDIGVSTLVPLSKVYYERLVGKFDGSLTLDDFAEGSGDSLINDLRLWRPFDGFLFSLFLSSHTVLSDRITYDHLSKDDVIRAYSILVESGDRTSQLGAIEVGLRLLPFHPEIESYIVAMVEQIRDDDPDSEKSQFKLLASLFILVDGELSRTHLFENQAIYYRRLASLGQASLICRELNETTINVNSFYEWVIGCRGEQFYLQSLADMRGDPIWNPDYASASYIKSNFINRIILAASKYEENIRKSILSKLIIGEARDSLLSTSNYPYSFIPGPLGNELTLCLPTQILNVIETQLELEKVTPSSFIALVNSARFFQLDSRLAEIAAKKIKSSGYRISNIENREQLIALINGLASVAAVTRSTILGNDLLILLRKYKHDVQYGLSIEEVLRVCLVASASHRDLSDWSRFLGDWVTELAFGNLTDDDGDILISYLLSLCHAVPELWVYCGRAVAALEAYNPQPTYDRFKKE
ncbi:hypothetical protein ABER99_26730 [Paenibacillus glucanolyticus]|uniref:hypothetical protein n=1 Tax=Paenibacillus glucanolyticus TaxID=59843 RepID=UPI00128B2894|nr:hypothetical protein [Paenibacillus glucanolyticus]MPY17492.1 hypothetical protein [Paenibacillus glucanolyticus]